MCRGRRRGVSIFAGQCRVLILSGPPGGEAEVRGPRGARPPEAQARRAIWASRRREIRELAKRGRDGRATPTATRPRAPTRQPASPGAGCPAERDNSEPASALLHANGLRPGQHNPDALSAGQASRRVWPSEKPNAIAVIRYRLGIIRILPCPAQTDKPADRRENDTSSPSAPPPTMPVMIFTSCRTALRSPAPGAARPARRDKTVS